MAEAAGVSKKKGAMVWKILGAVVGGVLLLLVVVKVLYGGGSLYPDLGTKPLVSASRAKVLVELPLPPGMVVTTKEGRVFFTYHPFAAPLRFAKGVLFELVKGDKRPYPNQALQPKLKGMMGITVDHQGRLWLVIPGQMENKATKIMAIDLKKNEVVLTHELPKGVGGLAQDLRVSRDGKTVYLADTGMFHFIPGSLVVFDVATKKARVVLKGHPSTRPQNWKMRTHQGTHSIGFGLLTFAVGLDGIALTPDDKWLYFATMSHDSLYKIPTAALKDASLSEAALAKKIVFVSKKPLSDGIDIDPKGRIYLTDVEAGRGLSVLTTKGKLKTLFRSKEVVWADCVHVGADGRVYMTDSAIPSYLDPFLRHPSKATLDAKGPYRIYVLPTW